MVPLTIILAGIIGVLASYGAALFTYLIRSVTAIIRVARENTHIESLPVMDDAGNLVGIIRSEDLHRVHRVTVKNL